MIFDENKLKDFQELAIKALASDDDLFDSLVLKGGNAIDLLLKNSDQCYERVSQDLDYSIRQESELFTPISKAQEKLHNTLRQTFLESGYEIIDFQLTPRPASPKHESLKDFWGGFSVKFKILESSRNEATISIDQKRRLSTPIDQKQRKHFEIDLSCYEYLAEKHIQKTEVDFYEIYIYSPEMIICEKIRALCQQMQAYKDIVPQMSRKPRAKDFYDIKILMEKFPEIDLSSEENKDLLSLIFQAKRVPIDYIFNLKEEREFHKPNWNEVVATAGNEIKWSFDECFEFLTQKLSIIRFP